MAPKKKGGKKKKGDDSEPPHDPSWERTVDSGKWERPVTDLPDANTWPTWGALRERVLSACKEVRIIGTGSLRDAFCNEIVKLSPPELSLLEFRGSCNLRNFVVSPMEACPSLSQIDLSECSSLDYVMVQSQTVRTLHLQKCPKLHKALIHCPKLTEIKITDNPELETVMIWSDELTSLDLTGCNNIVTLKLQCPSLVDSKLPPLKLIEQHVKPVHPPISMMLKENYSEAAKVAAEQKEDTKGLKDDSVIPHVHRPL